MGDQERSERIREEIDQKADDPLRRDADEIADETLLVGRVDRVAERAAERFTADAEAPGQGAGVDPDVAVTPETGEGGSLTLTADGERELRRGDEVDVLLPAGGGEGWSYEIEGDFRAIDVYQRAEMVTMAGSRHAAPVGSSLQFIIRAERKGKATVRFEPMDGGDPLRLRIKVR